LDEIEGDYDGVERADEEGDQLLRAGKRRS
jgi:hypothetical protein